MAVRIPLYNNAGNIQEMSAPQIQSLKDFIKYRFYTLNPVDLQVDVGNGTIGSIDDTRLKSGTQANSSSSFPNEATTGEPQTVTTTFNNIKQVLATTPTLTNDTGNLYPVYYDSQNNIQAMNLQDMKDTLIHPVIDDLASTNDTTGQAGTFFISSSTTAADTNKEVVSTTPVYTDTRANTSSFLAANIPAATNSTLDYPTSITNYYIHKNKPLSSWASGFTFPFKIRSDNDLQVYPSSDFQTMIDNFITYTVLASTDGYTIRYALGTSSANYTKGSGIADTKLTGGSGNYQTLQLHADDYRAMEFPDGSPTTINTYYLRLIKA